LYKSKIENYENDINYIYTQCGLPAVFVLCLDVLAEPLSRRHFNKIRQSYCGEFMR